MARVSLALLGQIEVSQQTAFRRQAMYTGKERLQSIKVGCPFDCDQVVFPFLPRPMPALCDVRRTFCGVGCLDLLKPGLLDQPLIFSGRTVHVIANRAPRGDFFMGNHSAHNQRIAEEHSSTRLQHPKHLAQQTWPGRNVTQDIISEDRVQHLIVKRKLFGSVALFETRPRGKTFGLRELVGIVNARRIHIQTCNPAANVLRQM